MVDYSSFTLVLSTIDRVVI